MNLAEYRPRLGLFKSHLLGHKRNSLLRNNAGAQRQPRIAIKPARQIHRQHPSAWAHEIDLRPYKEPF